HELSPQAAIFAYPVDVNSDTAWRGATLSPNITWGAQLLLGYATEAGGTPMASEWWHFNDLEGVAISTRLAMVGEFYTSTIYSRLPR
ncbi:MAG: hypothetical protein LBE35_04390, partial [Clostridiales bacterium]|nr:hypothetical protein [Clostridiales bacterium]